ncbi:IS110 family transposase [Bradyrhizobium sp. USDA 313]|uniref:IS110 family transposase n=1 Tax=Bradyrhizobium sp. USDA 313 TaxID=3156307 RepID=UPI003518FB41
MAIELSKAKWLVGMLTPLSDKISLRSIPCGAVQSLIEIIDRTLDKVLRATGQPARIVSCYEAGYDGFWLHRVLDAHGVTNHVIDAGSLLVSRKARRAKTDRLDAEKLVRVLVAFWRGEPKVCSVVQPPSIDEEDAKRQHREREFLMKERVQHIGRIKGLLATQGVYEFQPSRRDWQSRLAKLITGDGRPLPPRLAAEIDRHCRRLATVNAMLKEIDEERDAAVKKAAPLAPCASGAQRLAQLKGIGSQIATVLTTEVFYRRFKNRRGLGSYLGLTPSPFQSGGMDREQGITKAGNPRGRTISIELAWLWLRYQPQSTLARWFHERTNGLKGRVRRIIIVAVARKLMIALWRYLETGLVPDNAELKA